MDKLPEKFRQHSFTIAIVAVVVILLILVCNVYLRRQIYNSVIQGHWIANEDFCKRSGIDGMMLQIGPNLSSWREERLGYLIMHGGGAIIINKRFGIRMTGSIFDYINPFTSGSMTRGLKLFDLDADGNLCSDDADNPLLEIQDESLEDPSHVRISKIMPTTLRAEIDLSSGCMQWFGKSDDPQSDEETSYAELYRDNIASSYAGNI